MNIVADEQIALVRETFSRIGKIRAMPPESITNRNIRRADMLLIRSVTRVTGELLNGTKVKIIGTATSGIDHIDTALLRERGIKLVSAPGCNARAVAEYVLASLLAIAEKKGSKLKGRIIGIVGVGHVGSLVARFSRAMGMKTMLNDPPLAAKLKSRNGGRRFVPLSEILKNADIITLHVPLTTTGRYATRHMVNDDFFARLRKKIVLVNTSRGAVIDERSLLAAREMDGIDALVLDVWEHEPAISHAVLQAADIGTQHIAGHSFLGRLRGTAMVYDRLCRILGIENPGGWSSLGLAPSGRNRTIPITCRGKTDPDDEVTIARLVHRVCDPLPNVRGLRKYLQLPRSEQPVYFKHVRESYKLRPEFVEIKIKCRSCSKRLLKKLSALGFARA